MGGVLLGAANTLSNHGFGPAHVYVAKVVGNDWAWLAAGYAAAWGGASWKAAAQRAAAVLYPAVLAYYFGDWWLGRHSATPMGIEQGIHLDAIFWIVESTATAVLVATLVSLRRRGGVVGVVAGLAVPAYITWHAFTTHSWLSAAPATDPELHVVTGIMWPAALLLTLGVLTQAVVRSARDGRRR